VYAPGMDVAPAAFEICSQTGNSFLSFISIEYAIGPGKKKF